MKPEARSVFFQSTSVKSQWGDVGISGGRAGRRFAFTKPAASDSVVAALFCRFFQVLQKLLQCKVFVQTFILKVSTGTSALHFGFLHTTPLCTWRRGARGQGRAPPIDNGF